MSRPRRRVRHVPASRADRSFRRERRRVEPSSIVGDRDAETGRRLGPYADDRGIGVAANVVQCLLDDAQDLRLGPRRQPLERALGLELGADAKAVGEVLDVRAEDLLEARRRRGSTRIAMTAWRASASAESMAFRTSPAVVFASGSRLSFWVSRPCLSFAYHRSWARPSWISRASRVRSASVAFAASTSRSRVNSALARRRAAKSPPISAWIPAPGSGRRRAGARPSKSRSRRRRRGRARSAAG